MTNTEKILEEFRKRFGHYWSKLGDNAYIADPVNNTRPIILDRESVEYFISESIHQAVAEERKRVVVEILELPRFIKE